MLDKLILKALDNVRVCEKNARLSAYLVDALRAESLPEASGLCRQIIANTQNFDRDIRTIFIELQQQLSQGI
ncbi:MAG: hypothetical protein A3H51_00700 [Candidatus Spechtbacteria bacterium RIFCSPLOWO2_02_FULL_38_8]|uniref:Uncharacterized protein n=1 Tax=Candidatus Spechtbacteria bacterium RIFCSPLOWO2_02_FULL_38_8 TaxID=1802164 RepID=A0A1G2HJE4_9BACT|nr:MAG: hypothetical protein A3H51_00700 [Candidatus Spechtbacteria bacterium RIFCSPLOWO2_02_FULL_38_8]